eukprot:978801-Prymnesium_polylepis.2
MNKVDQFVHIHDFARACASAATHTTGPFSPPLCSRRSLETPSTRGLLRARSRMIALVRIPLTDGSLCWNLAKVIRRKDLPRTPAAIPNRGI